MDRKELRAELTEIRVRLEPDAARVQEARQRADALVKAINDSKAHGLFRVKRVEPHGSHSRNTAIRMFKDYDCLVVLDGKALRTKTGSRRSPQHTVQMLGEAAASLRAGLVAQGTIEVRRQDHSVGVKYPSFAGGEFRVDLVPALHNPAGGYFIPERSTGEWITVRPKPAAARLRAVPARARDAILLLKGWRSARGKARLNIPSYALEVLVFDTYQQTQRRTLLELVRSTLQRMAPSDARKRLLLSPGRSDSPAWLLDPTTRTNILSELDNAQKNKIIARAREALELLELAEQGEEPRSKIRQLFLPKSVRALQ